jgi:GNAT superfamily N-acetyltransferase
VSPAAESVELLGGQQIGIRPIRTEDRPLIGEAFDRLSPESRYRRFFAPLQRLSSEDLTYLTEVDHSDYEAMVAVDPATEAIIGVARYVRAEDPAQAEVAVVVGDPWQGRGVASALLERLVERAREAGITHFVALVMSDNEEALELFRNLAPGGSWTRRSSSGHTEMLIELPEPGRSLSETRLGRVLSTVAREALSVNPWRVLRQAILRRPTEEMRVPPEDRHNRPFR